MVERRTGAEPLRQRSASDRRGVEGAGELVRSLPEAVMLVRDRLHPLTDLSIVGTVGLVTNRHAAARRWLYTPAVCSFRGLLQASDSFPPARGCTAPVPGDSFARIVEHSIDQQTLQPRVLTLQAGCARLRGRERFRS